jgi:predicted homoserine dehydrogenase-like protein
MGLRDRLEELGRTESPIRVGLVGAGQMGRGFVAQVEDIPGMEVVAAADIDPERALAALRASGRDAVEGTDGRVGRPAATQDPMELVRSGSVDVMVEATGIVEIGARVAYEAILGGKHVVMLNVETDVTVGAILGRLADSAGVVYTGSAGDEPGAIMELYDFARSLGFEVVVAGKGKNNPLDHFADAESIRVEAGQKGMNPKMLASFVDGTKTMVEMAALANATGFVPDVPGMHGPEETVPDRLAETFSLREDGGILSGYGVVDYVRGVAPGVFVILRSPEGPVRETLDYLGQGPVQAIPSHEPGDTHLRGPRRHLRRAYHHLRPLADVGGRGRGQTGPFGRRQTRGHRLRRLLRVVEGGLRSRGHAAVGAGGGSQGHATGLPRARHTEVGGEVAGRFLCGES